MAQDDARVGSDAHADAGPHGLADAFVPLDAGAEVAADVTPDVGPLGPSSCARVPSDNPTRDGRRAFLDMTIVAGGFAEHEAQRVYVFTRDYNLKTPLGYGSAVVQAGAFQLTFPEGYARFSYQPMFYFIDVNGDGRCDEAAGDHPGYMVSSGWNPVANEPLMHGLHHTHVPDVRGERVCDVLNACR